MSTAEYPFESLSLNSASLSSSVNYNPYSEIPPRHRWELGIGFNPIHLRAGDKAVEPYISYTVDLGDVAWPDLTGDYAFKSEGDGSDFWHGDENLGPVGLTRITFKHLEGARFLTTAYLLFYFSDADYTPQMIELEFEVEYAGFKFRTPLWNEPEKVSLPSEWAIPSPNPLWSDEEITNFIQGYVNPSNYRETRVEHSSTSTITLLP